MTYFIKIKLCFQTILIILSRPGLFWRMIARQREPAERKRKRGKKGGKRMEWNLGSDIVDRFDCYSAASRFVFRSLYQRRPYVEVMCTTTRGSPLLMRVLSSFKAFKRIGKKVVKRKRSDNSFNYFYFCSRWYSGYWSDWLGLMRGMRRSRGEWGLEGGRSRVS